MTIRAMTPRLEALQTDETRSIDELLKQEGFEDSFSYRYNVASIRVRVIDPRFEGLPVEQRDGMVERSLEKLPEAIQGDITTLLTVAPSELQQPPGRWRGFLRNLEFNDPSPSLL